MSAFGMKIEIKKLNSLGKYIGNFSFEYLPEDNLCLIPLCKIDGAVKVTGSYEIYDDDSVGVDITVNYLLSGECSYCLTKTQKRIDKSFEVLFVPEDDPDNYFYDGVNIDLTTAVNDAILFSQPNLLLCKEDCTGIDLKKKD